MANDLVIAPGRFKRARISAGLTIAQAVDRARELGDEKISTSIWSRYETGQLLLPRRDRLKIMAQAIGVSDPGDLLHELPDFSDEKGKRAARVA